MSSRVELAIAILPFAVCACGGQNEDFDAGPAEVADAAPLTIGDICHLLAPATCERDAECFQELPPPCEESLIERCCGEASTCDQINGVTKERVDDCISAIYEETCAELEELPVPCREIAAPMGQARRSSDSMRGRLWLDSIFVTGETR